MPKKPRSTPSIQGFTLMEVLIAIIILSLVVAPASLWLFKTRKESKEIRRLEGLQALQVRMNRMVLTGRLEEIRGPVQELPGAMLEIRFANSIAETRVIGTIREKSGKTLSSLVYPGFQKVPE